MGTRVLFGRKNRLQVDLGNLGEHQQQLGEFLQSNLKVDVTPSFGKLVVDSDKVTAEELQHLVTKFIYKRNLNNTHYASLTSGTVKIRRFKEEKKPEKKSKHPTAPAKFAHGFQTFEDAESNFVAQFVPFADLTYISTLTCSDCRPKNSDRLPAHSGLELAVYPTVSAMPLHSRARS